jgi:hypothetical protein
MLQSSGLGKLFGFMTCYLSAFQLAQHRALSAAAAGNVGQRVEKPSGVVQGDGSSPVKTLRVRPEPVQKARRGCQKSLCIGMKRAGKMIFFRPAQLHV